ncbi:protein kinase domain-containing protein [Legionella spiritensis]|uniref:Protein kinase domain protein n=1 Tax=Legionella spiritensis TaxID=452 RepID=A0A0W0Z465_LEGSP|nr:protein kinase [Legionella spiritensis]KTD63906.1 Protein kinase domain protein [Legionella spiritensis]SNV36415.1 Protein kinase domain [Legionella spiritensis]
MGKSEEDNEIDKRGTLFSVQQKSGEITCFFSDFSQLLGTGEAGDVYKGYRCSPKEARADHGHCRINESELTVFKDQPVAIKSYKEGKMPSAYQVARTSIATFDLEDRTVLIMEFLDGFQIAPDFTDNKEISRFTFLQTVDVAWQLVLGLNQLHYRNTSWIPVVHGDVSGSNIKIKKRTEKSIDVHFLDYDYTKPISSIPQQPQGTPEFIALEVLDGYYSEASDFYALTPVLLSLFGAKNPLQKMFDYRDAHTDMAVEDLIKRYTDIGFCSEGMFSQFKPEPPLHICKLLDNFIKKMGAKDKHSRPSPEAILEFFTSLRQWCLANEAGDVDTEYYLLRLGIASNNEHWLREERYLTLFAELPENMQERLIDLMSPEHYTCLYKWLSLHYQDCNILPRLEKIITSALMEKSTTIKTPSKLHGMFKAPVTQKEISWLLTCFANRDETGFFLPESRTCRKKLEQCKEPDLAPLISALMYGLQQRQQFEIKHCG